MIKEFAVISRKNRKKITKFASGGGEGAEVVYALRNDSTLASEVLEAIGSEGQITRKYYQRRLPENPMEDYYFIHRLTGQTQPILVEYGFIDNENDAVKLQNDLLNYVEAVVRALANYAGYPYTPPAGSGDYYIVQKGDSLWSIARRFGITVQELRDFNNLNSDTLQIGQYLKIPGTDNDTPDEKKVYIVERGDSLWSIANKFGTTVDELKRLNNLTSNLLQIGQELIILGTSNQEPDNENSTTLYTVQKGDSLWAIAKRFGVTVDDIIQANNLTSNVLSIGQNLIIPTSSNMSPTTYTVQKGDSLWSIANRFGVTVDALKQRNNLTSNLLSIGQQLIIPN